MARFTISIPKANGGEYDITEIRRELGIDQILASIDDLKDEVDQIVDGNVKQFAAYIVSDEIVCASGDDETVRFTLAHLPIASSVHLECDGIDLVFGKDFNFEITNDENGEPQINPQVIILNEPLFDESVLTADYLRASLD